MSHPIVGTENMSESEGEIRDSQISRLLEKVAGQNYGKYLHKARLSKLRGFEDQLVTFDFPVTALIGPNGGGKTTILGAAALPYKSIRPRHFFAKSGIYDDNMQDWKIECEVVDKSVNRRDTFRRTASFRQSRWNREPLDRDVLVFGVTRTVPANERKELQQCIAGDFSVDASRVARLQETVIANVGRILGKDIAGYQHIRVDDRGRVTLLTGRTTDGVGYSEFHFGAGESSVIRMVMEIETSAENSLILVEEIENGLHPLATVRMVEYLIDVAERKKAQAIFTTHSNDALKPLPARAIWAAVGRRVFQGKLDIGALRAITGEVDATLAAFAEDEFACEWLRTMLRSGGVQLDRVSIHAMAGDGAAVAVNKHHNMDPTATYPSVCFIDGDSQQSESSQDQVFRLPGESPEGFIFHGVRDGLRETLGILSVALHRKYEEQNLVQRVIDEVAQTNRDPHLLYSQIGRRLGLISEQVVCSAFLTVWCQSNAALVDQVIDPVKKLLSASDKHAEDKAAEDKAVDTQPDVSLTASAASTIAPPREERQMRLTMRDH